MHEFEKLTLLEKIGTVIEPIINHLTFPGVPFILFGKKEEEKENKSIFLENISKLKNEIKQSTLIIQKRELFKILFSKKIL